MIRALVVDDEKRVRQGFKKLTDWAAHGIRIVGEAKDGHAALAFLKQDEVDLLFVDISMPGMNGFELIAKLRDEHPRARSVILTCHHEFDYVQEALRLGAIDYIVKTLIGPDNADESIRRITERLAREHKPVSDSRLFHAAVCIMSEPGADANRLRQALPPEHVLVRLDEQLWIVPTDDRRKAEQWLRGLAHMPAGFSHAATVVSDHGCPRQEGWQLLKKRLPAYLFYEAPADPPLVDLGDLETLPQADDSTLDAAFAEWAAWRWLLFGEDWKRFIDQVENRRPEPSRLLPFLNAVLEEGLAYCSWLTWEDGGDERHRQAKPVDWRSWKMKLVQCTLQVQHKLNETAISREVAASLLSAMRYMHEHIGTELNQEKVARCVGMSRSYFSQCFKKFFGETFAETVRNMRMRKAKKLLSETGLSVYEIAGRCGFEDEKYFSRLFRDFTGQLPTEFRSQAIKHREEGI